MFIWKFKSFKLNFAYDSSFCFDTKLDGCLLSLFRLILLFYEGIKQYNKVLIDVVSCAYSYAQLEISFFCDVTD